jgi:hypothetical protein
MLSFPLFYVILFIYLFIFIYLFVAHHHCKMGTLLLEEDAFAIALSLKSQNNISPRVCHYCLKANGEEVTVGASIEVRTMCAMCYIGLCYHNR